MWTLAASVSDKYSTLAAEFYHRSRRYAEADEMKGNGERIITLAHCQTWMLLAYYEFKSMYFPRAWQSTGRAVGLALLLGLNRLDGAGLDVKQCLPPPKDWTEKEERRRTFWMCFCADRYASIGTGWAHRLDERDVSDYTDPCLALTEQIMTLLPSNEENFEKSRPVVSPSLEQAFSDSAANNVSPVSSVILITSMLGRNLTHLHRPTPQDNEEDLNGAFWQRHRQLESTLSNISIALPDHLRLPGGLPDPNVIFMNMLLQTSVICLHQAAIFKAERNRLPQTIIDESRARCVTGAAEITRIMRMTSHIDLGTV
jgi:Fungal specific transcription factor domain